MREGERRVGGRYRKREVEGESERFRVRETEGGGKGERGRGYEVLIKLFIRSINLNKKNAEGNKKCEVY